MTSLTLAVFCFLLAATSGAVLLAKVYGLGEMALTVPTIVAPSSVALLIVWLWARRNARTKLASALAIGFFGGLLSTLAYDLTRLPFQLSGYLVFMTNSTYGMWITDSAASSRYTEVMGWLYHFSNGITFSIMYALFMKGQHWIWGIIYAFFLESIAVFSRFGQVFNLSGNYGMIGIAYLAHVSYGLPIGLMVQRWEASEAWMARNRSFVAGAVAVFFAAFLVPLLSPRATARDAETRHGVFRAEGTRLAPFMQRIRASGQIAGVNPGSEPLTIRVAKTDRHYPVPPGDEVRLDFKQPGIFQIYVETTGRTQSSFVIVEPVEDSVQ